ncbi:MAG: hypothetical protein V4614_14330 [Pseudomonadota bacterium]
MSAHVQLSTLQSALNRLRADSSGVMAFSEEARGLHLLAGALPPRFNEVLLQLLDRLESSALFTEESCSFSHTDLLDNLQMWLDKAQLQLQKN